MDNIELEVLSDKVKTLASLQLYALEQDGEARRAMERAFMEATIRQSREIAIWQIATLLLSLFVALMFVQVPLLFLLLLVWVLLVWRCIAVMASGCRKATDASEMVLAARAEVDGVKTQVEAFAKAE